MMMKTRNLLGLLAVVLFAVAALFVGSCDDLGGEWGRFHQVCPRYVEKCRELAEKCRGIFGNCDKMRAIPQCILTK